MGISLQDEDIRPGIEVYQQLVSKISETLHEVGDKLAEVRGSEAINRAYDSYMEFTQDWINRNVVDSWASGQRSLVAYGESFAIGDSAVEVCEEYQEELKQITKSAFEAEPNTNKFSASQLSDDKKKAVLKSIEGCYREVAKIGDEFSSEMQEFIQDNSLMNAILQLGRNVASESLGFLDSIKGTVQSSKGFSEDDLFSEDTEPEETPFTLSTKSSCTEEDIRATIAMYGDLSDKPAQPKDTAPAKASAPAATPTPAPSSAKVSAPKSINTQGSTQPDGYENLTEYFQGL